jgi:hypothetical protein
MRDCALTKVVRIHPYNRFPLTNDLKQSSIFSVEGFSILQSEETIKMKALNHNILQILTLNFYCLKSCLS